MNGANGAGGWPRDREMPRVDPKPEGGAAAQLSEFTFDLEVLSYCARAYARHMKFFLLRTQPLGSILEVPGNRRNN